MFIVYRASGADIDPQQFAATYKLDRCSFWLRWEPNRPGKSAPQTSGFRLPLPDAKTGPEAVLLIRTFIKGGEDWLEALIGQGVHSEVDVGLTVGSEATFTASVTFDPSFLGELARHQIGLVCSAYPSSD